jgi:hypothetical protein
VHSLPVPAAHTRDAAGEAMYPVTAFGALAVPFEDGDSVTDRYTPPAHRGVRCCVH